MSMIKRLGFLIILALLLSGCGPMYKTTYSYIPPQSKNGRMCIMQCMQTKQMCEQMCEMKKENCRSREMNESRYRYQEYAYHQKMANKPIERSPDSFYYGYSCHQDCNCVTGYNDCYTVCGGQVLQRRECVAFCNQ